MILFRVWPSRSANGEPGLATGKRVTERSRAALVLALLLLVGALLRVAHWGPGEASDDSNYMNYAARMLQGEAPPHNMHSVRFGYVFFLAAGMRLFGTTTSVCQALGIGVFIATALLLFDITRRLSAAREGLLAVLLFVLLPLDVVRSTCALPDGLMTLLVLGASLLYLLAKTQVTSTRQLGLGIGAGLALGWAASVKEPAVIAGLAFAFDLLATTRDRRGLSILFGIALGGVAVLGLESLGFLAWTGDALFRIQHTSDYIGAGGPQPLKNPFSASAATYYLRLGSDSWSEFGLHGYLLFLGALLAINRRSKSTVFPLVFCGVLAAYLSVGSMSLSRYVQIWQQPRYFHVVLVMGCVYAAIELLALGRHLKLKPYVVTAAGLGFVAISLWAAKQTDWRGTVPVAKWLGELHESRKADFVVLEDFARMQALEHRQVVAAWPMLPDDEALSPEIIAARLAGRGLVVDQFAFDREDLRDVEVTLTRAPEGTFRHEEIRGDSWPPYKRWIGIGEQENVIGRIWWPASDLETPADGSRRPR